MVSLATLCSGCIATYYTKCVVCMHTTEILMLSQYCQVVATVNSPGT